MPPAQNEMTVKEMYDDLKHLIEDIKAQNRGIHEELKTLQTRVNLIENNHKEDNNSLITLQREIRKNNLVIFGLPGEEDEDLLHKILEFLKTVLKVQISEQEINDVYRFGKGDKDRPILVKLVSAHKKFRILKQGILLKGTKISISNDLIKEDREKQKILRKHLKLARNQGLEAKIINYKLLVNNSFLTVNDLYKIEEKQTIQNIESENTAQSTENPTINSDQTYTNSEIIKASKSHRGPRSQNISSGEVSKSNQTVKKPHQQSTIYSEYITRSKSIESDVRRKK